jgi:hypothetical protein
MPPFQHREEAGGATTRCLVQWEWQARSYSKQLPSQWEKTEKIQSKGKGQLLKGDNIQNHDKNDFGWRD